MKQSSTILSLAGLVSMASAHGFITSPQARMPGSAMQAACGQQVFDNQQADNYGNIQGELQVAATQSDYNAAACDITLCKGFKFADNKANVMSYKSGQVVPISFDIRAPHTGVANVSIVNTATNSVIGKPLISWSDYASNSVPIQTSQEKFSITMPDVSSQCGTAGACVIQHWWNAASIDQTYESCIDFTMGSGSNAAVVSSSAPTDVSVSSSSTASVPASSIATSAAAAITSAPAASNAAPVSSAISSLTQAIPTSLLTSVLPSALPTGSANSSGSAPIPSSPLPDGFTIQDLLEWLSYMMSELQGVTNSNTRRHARALHME